ncbi:MAG: preprotein translocase subunit SecG [Candidatus Saccharibacteria bacterium]
MAKTIVTIFDILFALGLISTVHLQSGKSAGLSGSIAGASEAIFGKKKGLDELFEKLSTILAVGFMILTLALALM